MNDKNAEHYFIKPEDPNFNEICSTTEYAILNEKWKAYIKLEVDNNEKSNYFIDFCTYYSTLLKSQLAVHLSQKISIEIIKESLKFSSQYNVFTKSIETLYQAKSFFKFTKLEDYLLNYFYCFLEIIYKFNSLIPHSTSFFESIFSKREIAGELGTSSFFEKCIPEYYLKKQSIVVCQYLQLFLSTQVDNRFYETINTKKTFKTMISIMNDSKLTEPLKPQILMLICTFYQKVSPIFKNLSTFIHDNNFFKSIEAIMTTDNRPYFYSLLIITNNDDKSPPPNSKNLNYVYSYYQSHEDEQSQIFDMIFTLIQSDALLFNKINSIVPIKKWIDSTKINTKNALTLTTTSYTKIPEDTPVILQHFFRLLERDKDKVEFNTYLKCFNLIDNLFARKLIALKYLNSLNFLKIFVLNPTSSDLSEFFTKTPTFAQLTLDIYSNNQDVELKEKVFDSIVILHKYFDKTENFISLCSAFLIIAPTVNNCKRLIKEIEENDKYYLVIIFAVSFSKSLKLTDNFISLNLHKWISNLFDNNLITLEILSNFFASLVVQKPYRELNNLIDSFDKSHPIFSLDKKTIDRIVYGWKEIETYPHRPIRVTSLFHLLDCPERCSPYNAWVIGKFCLNHFEDIEKLPFLPCVANRFMHIEDVERVLKYPKMFEQFCDLSYDHFSMFQFYDGNEEMTIDFKYSTISFWFIFSEELSVDVPIFHTNNLFFYLNQESLTAICNNQTVVVDCNPTKWTHAFIRLESSLMSQTIKVTLNNENTFCIPLKSKINEFTSACFSAAIGSPMMFLGSAIRFSSNSPKDFSMIYKNGPGFIEPSNELNESLLVTPFSLSNAKIPLNCFPVPYMGFPIHNLSYHNFKVMLRHLRETDDVETYNSIFRAICNVNKLTNNNNKKFWKQLLESITHAKIYPSADLLKSALSTVITSKNDEKVFSTLLYGNEIWDFIDNEALICTLFDSFPNVIWKNFQDSDVFLAKIVEKNPSNSKIINKIFCNWKKVPKTLKLIFDLLKCAPITDWKSTQEKFRPESTLQFTILDCILNIIDKKNYEIFKTYFPFEELRYMFITSSPKLAVKFYHLIVTFSAFIVDFIQLDYSFLIKIASLCNFVSIWKDSIFLITGDPDFNQKMIVRPSLISILLHLIWSGSSLIIHSLKYKIDNEKILKLLEKSVEFIIPLLPKIIVQQEYYNIFVNYYPIILHYESIFDSDFKLDSIQSPVKIPQLNISNLSENDDPTWSHLISGYKTKQFPNPPSCLTTKEFLHFIISQFISIDENSNSESNKFDFPPFLINLFTELILNSGNNSFQMALNLLIWFPLKDESKLLFFIKDLIHNILTKTELNTLNSSLLITLYFANKHYLSDDAYRVYADLFNLSNRIFKLNGKEGLLKYSNLFMNIILEIFSKVPNNDYKNIFDIIKSNIQVFSQMALNAKMLKSWIYSFSIAFKDIDELNEIIFFLYRLQYQEENKNENESEIDYPQITKELIQSYKSQWDINVSNTENSIPSEKEITSISLISETSFEYTKKVYIANCKHFLVRHLLTDSFLFIDSTFPIFIEGCKWSNFIFLHKLMRSSQSNFKPKSYYLSPRCEPFYPPKVLTPSPYEVIKDNDFKNSPIIDLFKQNFANIQIKRNKRSLLNLFSCKFNKWGNPSSVVECNFYRYNHSIPTVSFWYPKSIILLLNAKLSQNEIELLDATKDEKEKHIFLESLLLGHYGKTSLFLSHLTIIIPVYSILHLFIYSKQDIEFWTFHSGHFILKFDQSSFKQISHFIDKINKVAVESYPIENYLTQAKTVSQLFVMWKRKKISAIEFIYSINCLSKRSFVDLNNFPYMPKLLTEGKVEKNEFYDGKIVSSLLSRILPFYYYSDPKAVFQISQCRDYPAILLALPEMLIDINGCGIDDCHQTPWKFWSEIRVSFEDPNNDEKLINWIRANFTFTLSRSNSLDPRSIANLSGNDQKDSGETSKPKNSQFKMKNLLERQKTTVISISRRYSRLVFVNNQTDKIFFTQTHPLYGLASSISTSLDGVFFVIDFAFGVTRAYKVIFAGGNPSQAKCISTFSIGPKPISSVSGYDWICASASGNRLALWEIMYGTVHRLIDFESAIVAISFNESGFFIWVALEAKVIIVGINGNILAEREFEDHRITAITHINKTFNAFCGTHEGDLFLLEFDLGSGKIAQKKLEASHKNPIEKIIIQRQIGQYLTLDSNGLIEKWDPEGNLIDDENPIFTACAICANPTHELCQFCNMPICKNCMPSHMKGPNCRHVTAFI